MGDLTEVAFYDRLAEFFDVMTDWQSRLTFETPFIEEALSRRRAHSLLDCACGTGWHAIELARHGYAVSGSDASLAMVNRAEANAGREGVAIPFRTARFQELLSVFSERFDAVLCLGNSFVHVLSEDAALGSLVQIHDCMHAGGIFILHNLNYDKRWKNKPRWFAVNSGRLEGKETLVWRFADYHPSSISFNIALFTKHQENAWSVQVATTPQRPYQKSELEGLLRRAGFGDLTFYGNLQGQEFDAERSDDLVILATAL